MESQFQYFITPPPDAELFEGELATFWFDKSGILCAVSKDTPRSINNYMENFELIRKISGNKRVCILADNTRTKIADRETQNYMAKEMPGVFKAMAVLSSSALGNVASTMFLYYRQQPVPIRTFNDVSEAEKWLKQYL